jgi:hypothetical protein
MYILLAFTALNLVFGNKPNTCISTGQNHAKTGFVGGGGSYEGYPIFDNEVSKNNNKHSLRTNTKDYGGKTH